MKAIDHPNYGGFQRQQRVWFSDDAHHHPFYPPPKFGHTYANVCVFTFSFCNISVNSSVELRVETLDPSKMAKACTQKEAAAQCYVFKQP